MLLRNINSKISLLTFLLFSCMFSVTLGLYFYDLIIIVSALCIVFFYKFNFSKCESEYLYALLYLVIIPNIFFILYQIFAGAEIVIAHIYILYNVILSVVYMYFVRFYIVRYVINHPYLVTILFLAPLLISIAMFSSSYINSLFVSIYGIEQQFQFRFGGIWGADVNQLGYYCSVMLIWCSTLLAFKKINIFFYFVVFLLCLVLTLLSGMRTGLAVFIVSLVVVSLFSKYYRNALMYNARIVMSTILIAILFLPLLDDFVNINILLDRFSFDLFFDQLTGKSGDGHVGNMYIKWFTHFSEQENLGHILFSMNSSWKYPDSFVLYYIANAGVIGVMLLLLFLICCLLLVIKTRSYVGFMVLLIMFAVAFKGNYPVNNMSMFIFTLLIYFESAMKADVTNLKGNTLD